MKITRYWVLAPALLASVAAQQTIDPLSLFVSEAFSVYTQITSILASAASEASAAAAASASSTLTSSTVEASATSSNSESTSTPETSSSSPSTSSDPITTKTSTTSDSSSSSSTTSLVTSETSSSPLAQSPTLTYSRTLSPAVLGTSSVLGSTAETGTNSPSPSRSSHDSNLPIILGCVLGGLAFGLFILALMLCCKRRRRGQSPRHRALSPGDDEVDGWRAHRASGLFGNRESPHHGLGLVGAAPLMSEHPAFRSHEEHENPFVPVPPPPRRTPIASGALKNEDTAMQNEDPFALTKEVSRASSVYSSSSDEDSGYKGAVAAGLIGAAAGAGLMHHHNKHKDESNLQTDADEKPITEPPGRLRVSRKPVPVNHVNNSEPWPYYPVSPIDPPNETAALTKTPPRVSSESRRSFSRDAARANAAFDQEYTPPPDVPPVQGHDRPHGHGLAAGATGLAAGAIGSAALAHHAQNRRRSRSSSSSGGGGRGQLRRHSQPATMRQGEGSDHSSSSSSGTSRESYVNSNSDTLVSQGHGANLPSSSAMAMATPGQPGEYEIPIAPATRSRRNSALGTGAPASAVLSYVNRPPIPSPLSSEVLRDRSSSPPVLRAQRRRSGPSAAMPMPPPPRLPPAAAATQYFPTFHDAGEPYGHPQDPGYGYRDDEDSMSGSGRFYSSIQAGDNGDDAAPQVYTQKGIVGDNGYPHMGIPRRKSGGEYDFGATGPLGPQTLPVVTSPVGAGEQQLPPHSRTPTMGSDDSSWRLSQGMPGGWQREYSPSPRNSEDYFSGSGSAAGHQAPRRLRASDFAAGGGNETAAVDGRGGVGVGQAL